MTFSGYQCVTHHNPLMTVACVQNITLQRRLHPCAKPSLVLCTSVFHVIHCVAELRCLLQQGVPHPPLACPPSSRRSITSNSIPNTPSGPMPTHQTAMEVTIGKGILPPATTCGPRAASRPPLRSLQTPLGRAWTACQPASWPTCLASLLGLWIASRAAA